MATLGRLERPRTYKLQLKFPLRLHLAKSQPLQNCSRAMEFERKPRSFPAGTTTYGNALCGTVSPPAPARLILPPSTLGGRSISLFSDHPSKGVFSIMAARRAEPNFLRQEKRRRMEFETLRCVVSLWETTPRRHSLGFISAKKFSSLFQHNAPQILPRAEPNFLAEMK